METQNIEAETTPDSPCKKIKLSSPVKENGEEKAIVVDGEGDKVVESKETNGVSPKKDEGVVEVNSKVEETDAANNKEESSEVQEGVVSSSEENAKGAKENGEATVKTSEETSEAVADSAEKSSENTSEEKPEPANEADSGVNNSKETNNADSAEKEAPEEKMDTADSVAEKKCEDKPVPKESQEKEAKVVEEKVSE